MKLDQIKEMVWLMDRRETLTQAQGLALIRQMGLDPSNLYQELEMSSRFVDTHRDVSQPSDRVQFHSHTFYEILFIRSGTGVQYLVGSDRYVLQRGDVVIIRPGLGHRPLLTGDLPEPYRRDVLWLSPEFVEGVTRMFSGELPVDRAPVLLRTAGTSWEETLRERFRAGVREAEEKAPGWEAMVLGNTVQLLMLLIRTSMDRGGSPPHVEKPELLDEVLAYMERNLTQKLTLAEVAQRFFVSESRIGQVFREKMGVSFHRCLTQQRLIAAKNQIAGGVSLELVSEQVGFQDYSTFYRAFKQEFGISPRQYRKMLSGGEAAHL